MSKQRVVKDEIWDDDWFYDLDPTEKLVWLFLLTNPRNNIAGVFKLNRRWGANSCGLDKDIFETILRRFEVENKIIIYSEWIILINFHKHQSKNPKVEKGVLRIIAELPKEIANLLPMDSLCIAYPTLLNLTLLNSTLLNLTVSETSSLQVQGSNNENMTFKRQPDDFEESVVDYDGDGSTKTPPKPQTKKYPNAPLVFKIFEEVSGKYPANWKINKMQLLSAENLYTERGLQPVKNALEFYKQNKDIEFCPQITQPSDLDAKWTKLGEFKKKTT